MDSIKYMIFCGMILLPSPVLSVTRHGAKGDEIQPTEMLVNNVGSATESYFVTLIEPKMINVFMEADLIVTLNYTIPCKSKGDSYILQANSSNMNLFSLQGNNTFHLTCRAAERIDTDNKAHSEAGNIEAQKYSVSNATLVTRGSVKLKLHGILLGIAKLEVKLKCNGSDITKDVTECVNSTDILERSFTVGVLRVMRPIDTAFKVILGCFISIVIMGFGCGLNLEVVKECLRKPIAPAIGLGCQYLLMPLIGFTVAKLVPIDNRSVTFGIFVCGVCPGGGASNVYSYLLGGDVNLSITMTLSSSVAALGMMPFWIYTLGRQFVDDDFEIIIPYISMLQTLAMITIPLFIGIFIKYKFPKIAVKYIKILKPTTLVMMVVFAGVGIYSNFYIFKLFRPEYFLAGALLPYCGYFSGGLVATLLRQPWTRIKTIALEVGMQNLGVAFFLMVTSFPAPLGDIAAMAPASSGIATPIIPMFITIPYLFYQRCISKTDTVAALTDCEIEVVKNDNKSDMKNEDETQFLGDENRLSSTDSQSPILVENLSSV